MKKIDRICIVDDDSILVYGMKLMMNEVDFCEEVLEYSNGLDAIEGLASIVNDGEPLPSIIFLDLNMPIMDGWEFLDEFIKTPNYNLDNVSIYIISSSVDPRDREKANEYEIVKGYILKPVTTNDFSEIQEAIYKKVV